MKPMKAFVTDGDQRPALAITRSLGQRGVSVLVGAEQPVSLASASRYCAGHVTYPSPYHHPEAFDRFLLDLVVREGVDVVVPVTDVSTHLVARNWPALGVHCATTAPSFEAFDAVANKMHLLQRAQECDVPIPRTHFVEGRAGVTPVLGQIEYPAVVKPLRSRIRTDAGWLMATVQYAHNESELLRLYDDTECLANYPSMIQERIVGPGTGVFVLCDHGRPRAAFAHRRIREKPPSGGASVVCESIALDPELLDQAMRLLGPIAWHGVAMMEFKQDRRTGRSFLMEVNGRFWGSLHLAVLAGIDFPYLSYQLALGLPLEIPRGYQVGVKSRWLLGDLDHLFLRLFHSNGDQHLPDGTPSRVRALVDFLRPNGSGLHYDVINRDDPRPFVHEAQQYAKHLSAAAAHIGRRLMAPGRRPELYPAVTSNNHCRKQENRHAGALE
jgi:predicted ATP-grasp superfamily ATP-dependent carboligase